MSDHKPPRIAGYSAWRTKLRHPTGLYRVRWSRKSWKPHRGGVRWGSRLYLQGEAAQRLAEHLLESGAEVEISTYDLKLTGCVRYRPLPPPPPRRRPGR